MQGRLAVASKTKIGYLDPFIICEARWAFPLKWPDAAEELKDCKTAKDKQKKRREFSIDLRRKVSIYIATMMDRHRDAECIWAPYLFGYVV